MFSSQRIRDDAIDTTSSNLLLSGTLLPEDVGKYLEYITSLDDLDVAKQLLGSRSLLDLYLENHARANKN